MKDKQLLLWFYIDSIWQCIVKCSYALGRLGLAPIYFSHGGDMHAILTEDIVYRTLDNEFKEIDAGSQVLVADEGDLIEYLGAYVQVSGEQYILLN